MWSAMVWSKCLYVCVLEGMRESVFQKEINCLVTELEVSPIFQYFFVVSGVRGSTALPLENLAGAKLTTRPK